MAKKIVMFDFDGVIVESFDMCFRIGQAVLPGISKGDYSAMFDGNIYEALESYDGIVNRDDEAYFKNYTREVMEIAPALGIEGELRKLAIRYPLIIVTSTLKVSAQEYLEKYGLSKYFSEIRGLEETSKVKKISECLEKYESSVADSVFITDTLGDIREASHVGVPCIGVTWGFQDKERLDRGSPAKVIERTEDLASSIAEILS